VVTEYVKGMYVIYEFIIEEWYVSGSASASFTYQQVHNSYTYLSALLHLVYFESIKIAVLLSTLLLIVSVSINKNADKKSHFHVLACPHPGRK
jgi:hypothetical protein